MKKGLIGLAVIPVIAIVLLIQPSQSSVDPDIILNKLKTISLENEGNDQAIEDFTETDEYKNTCRELYQKWLKLRENPYQGETPEFLKQFTSLACDVTIDNWNN